MNKLAQIFTLRNIKPLSTNFLNWVIITIVISTVSFFGYIANEVSKIDFSNIPIY